MHNQKASQVPGDCFAVSYFRFQFFVFKVLIYHNWFFFFWNISIDGLCQGTTDKNEPLATSYVLPTVPAK